MTQLPQADDAEVRGCPGQWLTGSILESVEDSAAPGSWVMTFSGGNKLSLGCTWRDGQGVR